MSNYTHLTPSERDQIAAWKTDVLSIQTIATRLGRAGSTISRELKRNALEGGVYRPVPAEGAYLLRRQRPARLERDGKLRGYVVARLSEGWTPEQISGRLAKGIEIGLGSISTEAIYAWIYSKARKADRLWRTLTRGRPRRGRRKRASKDRIGEKTHISERSEVADQREELGHWEADLVICKRSRPVLVLHERKTRLTLISRLMGKTAAETVSALMAMVKRLSPALRGSITFDNGGEFARHALLRNMLSATTYFCDAYSSWQKGGVENTNGRFRRWLPRSIDLDQISDEDIQEIAMTLNSTPRKCLGFKTPIEAILAELGKDVQIRFA